MASEGDALHDPKTRFQLGHLAGRGGMGSVFCTQDCLTGQTVALKLMSSQSTAGKAASARFRREIEALRRLNHPSVVGYVTHGMWDEERPFVVMEWLEGEPLDRRIQREGRLGVHEAGHILMQVLGGLTAAHAAGVLHRDIKPSNIVVTGDPRVLGAVKLVDFGLSRSVHGTSTRVTRTGSVVGTPAYLSPEGVLGEDPSEQSDQWSAMVVFLEMVLGHQVFRGNSIESTIVKVLVGDLWIPERLWSSSWGAILERALERNPARRFSSVASLHEALKLSFPDLEDFRLTDDEIPPPSPEVDSTDLRKHAPVGHSLMVTTLPPPQVWPPATQPAIPLATLTTDTDATEKMDARPVMSDDDVPTLLAPTEETTVELPSDEAPTEQRPRPRMAPGMLDPPTAEENTQKARARRQRVLATERAAASSERRIRSRRSVGRTLVLIGAVLVALVSLFALWHPWKTERVVFDAAQNPGICSPGVEGSRTVEYLSLFGRRLRKTGETTVCHE